MADFYLEPRGTVYVIYKKHVLAWNWHLWRKTPYLSFHMLKNKGNLFFCVCVCLCLNDAWVFVSHLDKIHMI